MSLSPHCVTQHQLITDKHSKFAIVKQHRPNNIQFSCFFLCQSHILLFVTMMARPSWILSIKIYIYFKGPNGFNLLFNTAKYGVLLWFKIASCLSVCKVLNVSQICNLLSVLFLLYVSVIHGL